MQIDDFFTTYKDAGFIAAVSALVLAVLKMLPDYRRAKNEQRKTEAEALEKETSIKNAGFDQLKIVVEMLKDELRTAKAEIKILQSALDILKEKNDHLTIVIDQIKLHSQLVQCPADMEVECPLRNTVIKAS